MSWRINASGTKEVVLASLTESVAAHASYLNERQMDIVRAAADFVRAVVAAAPADVTGFDFTFGGHTDEDGYAGGDATYSSFREPARPE